MDGLDALVRRVDQDRWLASRFAPADVREHLILLYALNHEIARIGESVREPGLGDIRLAWWRDNIGALVRGERPPGHPLLARLREAPEAAALATALHAILEARRADFDVAPFPDWARVEAYVDGTAGALMRTAVGFCGHDGQALALLIEHAARAWGLTGLLRAAPFWRARGRSVLPPAVGLADLRARAETAWLEARTLGRGVTSAIFPAIGYVTLAPAYLAAFDAGREPSLIGRQVRLVVASATGRL